MFKSITIREKNISVKFQKNRIAIINDAQLLALVTQMPEAATEELVSAIKTAYCAEFKKEFLVKDTSMAVEIWGHVFADKFADAVKKISPVTFVDTLAEKISARCEVINIGEKGHDDNRFVWDGLAPFKAVIAKILLP